MICNTVNVFQEKQTENLCFDPTYLNSNLEVSYGSRLFTLPSSVVDLNNYKHFSPSYDLVILLHNLTFNIVTMTMLAF